MYQSLIKRGILLLLGCILVHSCGKENPSLRKNKSVSEIDQPLFTSLPPEETGLLFVNEIPESKIMNSMIYEYYYNGGGVAIGDIDNDGLEDVYLVANLKENRLYKNKGNLQFEDITEKAQVKGSFGWSTGVTMADINADGWLDIYVCKSGKGKAENRENELYINNKDGTFSEAAAQYGLNFAGYSTQALFFDFDLDNDLDIFLLNHNIQPVYTNNPEVLKTEYDNLAGDKLFKNENGNFIDISQEAGLLNNPLGFGLGVSAGDINSDGWPDIYVGNDYVEQDYLYLNNRDGTFSEILKTAAKHTSNFSMGTDIADFNNDGLADIISLDMVAEDNYGIKTSMSGMNPSAFHHAVNHGFHYQYMFNALQLNNGNNSFSEMAQLAGVSNSDWSWAPLFADFDNDGWKDLYITNGLKRDFRNNDFRKYKAKRLNEAQKMGENLSDIIEELIAKTPQRKTQNFFFQNKGDLTFAKKNSSWSNSPASFSNGASYADLDNDGDLDLVVNNIDSPAFLLKNNSRNNFVQFELKGPKDNPFGIGASISFQTKTGLQKLENYPTRGYQSAVSSKMHFGVGELQLIEEVHITWPDAKKQLLQDVQTNQRLKVNYASAQQVNNTDLPENDKFSFRELTAALGLQHQHFENDYDDFSKEGLLPHKLSQLGPAMAVGDINQDGLEDFFIGGAKGFPAELYFQQENGTFLPSQFPIWQKEKEFEDIAATFFDADKDGDLDLYVVSGGNEFDPKSPLLQDRIYLNDGKKQLVKNERILPKMLTSGACVKAADFDRDGDLDLFIGGRLIPGKYPFPAKSYLLQNNGGIFKDISEESAPALEKLGMVTDAVWTDFDGDFQLDLLIVGEWMPITFLKNENGRFTPSTPRNFQAESNTKGWWSSIIADDLDGDGDDDYLVGNLGLNYKYKASILEPFEVYCNDFDENGQLDIVLGYHDNQQLFPLRGRECSSDQMPYLKEKFPTYHEFGSANLNEVYGTKKLQEALHLKANTFASIIVQNEGNNNFNIIALPNRAQLSSVNGIITRDIDQDGHKDIIIAGNMYQSEIETPRNDASVGLVLMGLGGLKYETVAPSVSHLYLDGDIKTLAGIQLGKARKFGILAARNDDYLKLISIDQKALTQ